jgi:hypothetical protein
MSHGEDETISIGPYGILWIETEKFGPYGICHGGHGHSEHGRGIISLGISEEQ